MKNIFISLFLLVPVSISAQDIRVYSTFKDIERGIELSICSDSVTNHPVFGESYRLLLAKNINNDSIILKEYLDLNNSPDFPYDLNGEYSKSLGIIIIEGVGGCYLCDLVSMHLSEKIYPDISGCAISDNQGSYLMESKLNDNGTRFSVRIQECGWFDYKINNIKDIILIRK